ncbi:MAG TPA: hypothetical protein VGN18_15650 [Jatrophihabitans sp.]|jgi:hypothetical protein|uniref:hypothetical protein n=1 Tax=Jatrophihabitans sp. TaxID=1932789 RepID=UPI002DFAE0A8|nr:hypothetical protein [Jatrophihabitans sp.]
MTATKTGGTCRTSLAVALPAAQALLGVALLGRPGPFGRALSGAAATAPPRSVVRLLGFRLLVQGAATLALPGPEAIGVSAAVDATHGASMLLVAGVSRRHRRAALINALVAFGSTAVSARLATAHRGWRS